MKRKVLHRCKIWVIIFLKIVLHIVPKNKKLILFSAWNGLKFADNSMYVYEWILKFHPEFNVYWYTRDRSVFETLKEKKYPVVYSKSIKAIWIELRAIILVSAIQFGDHNPYFLTGNANYIDLGHGFPIKQSGFEQPDCTKGFIEYTMLLRTHINYYMHASSTFIMHISERAFKVEPQNIIFTNMARTDVLFDDCETNYTNEMMKKIKNGKKAIVYLPTHRSMGSIKMDMNNILDLKKIDDMCSLKECVFIIKKHFFHRNEVLDTAQYENIYDITNDSNVDTQVVLKHTDILVTDYSACYIDFLLLNRPILFYAYDLEEFIKTERDMYIPFSTIDAGYKALEKTELIKYLDTLTDTWHDAAHEEGRKLLRLRYFDEELPIGNSRENIVQIFQEIINGVYHTKWENELTSY